MFEVKLVPLSRYATLSLSTLPILAAVASLKGKISTHLVKSSMTTKTERRRLQDEFLHEVPSSP
jgi:hypothetical protein